MSNIETSTVIYREISNDNEGLLRYLDGRQQVFNVVDPKGNEHVFVENDIPRDQEITRQIVAGTVGFALFTDDGDYIGSYRSLDRAINAQSTAKIVVSADVEGAEPDAIILNDEQPF